MFALPGGTAGEDLHAHAEGFVHAIAFSPDGTLLASVGQDGTARIWDSNTGQARAILMGHCGSVYAVAFSPDGTTLATTGAYDGLVLLWDVAGLNKR